MDGNFSNGSLVPIRHERVTNNTRDVAAGELVFDGLRVVPPSEWLKEND